MTELQPLSDPANIEWLIGQRLKSERRVYKKEKDQPSLLNFHLTDAGNAEAFKELFGDQYVFVPEKKKWLQFDRTRWREDDQIILKMLGTVRERARQAVDHLATNPGTNTNDDRIKNIVKWCLSSESRMKLNAALSIAESMLPQYNILRSGPFNSLLCKRTC